MKSYLAATALALTLASPVLAQQAPAAGSAIQEQQQGQMLAESILGTSVYNNANETVGEVNDLLIGQDGRIVGVVVGVGGFLGIGERDVALPWAQVKMEMGSSASSATGATSATGTATSSGTATSGTTSGTATSTTAATPNAGTGPSATPGTVANDAATRTTAAASANEMRFVINISREDLRNMPEFRTLEDRASATPATPATGTAPRPAQ